MHAYESLFPFTPHLTVPNKLKIITELHCSSIFTSCLNCLSHAICVVSKNFKWNTSAVITSNFLPFMKMTSSWMLAKKNYIKNCNVILLWYYIEDMNTFHKKERKLNGEFFFCCLYWNTHVGFACQANSRPIPKQKTVSWGMKILI